MYHDSLEESKIDCDLLKAADKYLMEGLVAICTNHFKSKLTLENVVEASPGIFSASEEFYQNYWPKQFQLCQ